MVENLTALFGVQAALLLAPLVSIPFLVRVLGPESYGRVALAQALTGYFVLLTDYGFNLSATRKVAALQGQPDRLSRLFSAVIIAKAILCAVGFIAITVLVSALPMFGDDFALYALSYIAVVGNVLFPMWFFQGIERSRVPAACLWCAQTITLAAIFVFVRSPQDFRLVAGLQAATTAVAGVLSLGIAAHSLGLRLIWPGLSGLRSVFREGWHVFTSTLAVSLYSYTNTLVLGAFADTAAVGFFSAADKLIRAVQSCFAPLSQAAYPRVASLHSQSTEAALAFVRRLLRWQVAVAVGLSVMLGVLAEPLVELVFGSAFEPAVPLVRYMAPLPVIVGLSNIFGVQIMLNFGMKVAFSRILIASGLLNFALIISLSSRLGAAGAALSIVVTESIVTIAMMVALARRGLMNRLLVSPA